MKKLQISFGVTKEDVTMALESKKTVSSIYETQNNNDEDGISILEKVSTNVDEQSMITNKIAIHQLMDALDAKERQVIILRYYKGITQSETAKILGTSQVQVSRIEKKVLSGMKRKLTEDLSLRGA